MSIVDRAKVFATKAHAGQMRKDGITPYITHPEAVAHMVSESSICHVQSRPSAQNTMAAAWLHDVVEDCGVTLDEIEDEFGFAIRFLVDGVTDYKTLKPRIARHYAFTKKIYRYSLQDAGVMVIKLCDMLHNLECGSGVSSDFLRTMAVEKLIAIDFWEKEGLMIGRGNRHDLETFFCLGCTELLGKVKSKCLEIVPEMN